MQTLPWRAVRALWRGPRRREDRERTGPRIAVIGNCQAREIAQALRVLVPASPVTHLPMTSLARRYGSATHLAEALAAYDHVHTQQIPPTLLEGGSEELCRLDGRIIRFPTIVFSAFHPDAVYAGGTGKPGARDLARSPLGHYHSAIALCAYLLGLDVGRTVTLYRREVFVALGYLDSWNAAAADLAATSRAIGFDLDEELARWTRRGVFMHVLNHPKIFVHADIARRLLARSGIPPEPIAVEDYLADDLARDVVWPIYPGVAEVYGLDGGFLFKAKPRPAVFPALYDLPGFVAASFVLYAAQGAAALACERVDAWLGTPEIVALFEGAGSP
ncbi:WcbI family polysaccharide biosynthesis putative acetyltransferase [uncultured Methylobacterium sp.]|uniref:WcbI family polysaccharide biosynthesis putative acetyltransferase n=1 Tax=uncultured Methylobacterium sp. TaxID=157278 RepID=UPI0035CBB855